MIGVHPIVRAYSNLAFLQVHIFFESIAYLGDNGADISTTGSKTTAITDSCSAGSIGVPSETRFAEGVNVISHDAAITVAAHARGVTTGTVVGVASVNSQHLRSSTAGESLETEVDGIVYSCDACDGSNECAGEVHVHSRLAEELVSVSIVKERTRY